MATAIYRKQEAIKKYNNSKVTGKAIFAEDKVGKNVTKGAKVFYVTKNDDIYERIVDPNIVNSHFYETWSENTELLFSLDLDIKDRTRDESLDIVKNNIRKIKVAMKSIHGYDYDISNTIVLESNPDVSIKESKKYSYHVIFRGIVFQTHEVCKDFYIEANKLDEIEFGDISIYGLTCIRLCYCCKAGKKAILYPLKVSVDGYETMTEYNTSFSHKEFFNRTLITYIASNDDKKIKKNQMINKIKANSEPLNTAKDSIDNLNIEEMITALPYEICDCYDTWIRIGMCLYHLCDNNESWFKVWDTWSQQSDKYKPFEMKRLWSGFSRNKINIGYLINICRKNGVPNTTIFKNSKVTASCIIDTFPRKEIVLDRNENTIIYNQAKLETYVYKPHLDKKLVCVQSEKGTGKTSNLLKLLFEEENIITSETTMLFVSSRRTFGAKLMGDLKDYGFVLYSDIVDGDIRDKKVICQIDSIKRLALNMFEYIIIDECESAARYITSNHFVKNPKASSIVSDLELRIKEASHVYIMDADLSNRCMEYYKNVMEIDNEQDYQLIINTFKAFSEYTIVSMTYNDWVQHLLESIGRGLKLAVPMASNNKAKDLKTKIEYEFPNANVLLIHKETKDEDKVKNLMNVNTTWKEFDVVLYTPSVCMGVSFDLPDYFDNIYGYGCENSLGAQEFAQMLHRIREPKDKKIYLSLNLYREYDELEENMPFEEVEQLICQDYYLTHFDLHQNLLQTKMTRSEPDINGMTERILSYPNKNDPNYRLIVHNAKETISNKINFSSSLYGYFKEKEYKMDFFQYDINDRDKTLKVAMKDIRDERISGEVEVNVQGILDAPDIDNGEYRDLIKQRDEFMTQEDIQKINRHKFRACYELYECDHELDYDLVEEFNSKEKMKWYHNLTNIMATEDQDTITKLDILRENIIKDKWLSTCYMEFTTTNNYTHQLHSINLINHCGFDINNLDTILTHKDLVTNVRNCIGYIDSNKKELAYKFNTRIYNKNFDNMEFKEQLKTINTMISSYYGIKIKKISGSRKDISATFYKLSDNKIWENMPRETKIKPVSLVTRDDGNDPDDVDRAIEYMMGDDDSGDF